MNLIYGRLTRFIFVTFMPLFLPAIPNFHGYSKREPQPCGILGAILLNLYLIGSRNSCLQESSHYDLFLSARTAVRFTISQYNSPLSLDHVNLKYQVIDGCSNRDRIRGLRLISALTLMKNLSESSSSWSVFLGPPLGGDCNVASDWISNEATSRDTQSNLYQVEYACRLEFLGRQFAQVDRPPVDERTDLNLASVSMTVQTSSFASMFESFLRFHGWQNVIIVFEVSEVRMQNHVFVESLRMYMAYSPPNLDPIRIVGVFTLQCTPESVRLDISREISAEGM
ncbi:hypothetical protein AAHC03_0613 [Spirometra sp. Aus1]